MRALLLAVVIGCLSAVPDCLARENPSRIDVGFSPDAGAEALSIKAVASAKKSIHLAAYSFTSKPIAQALIQARRRGIDVRCTLDKSNTHSKSGRAAANLLVNAGIAVRIDSKHAIHHNKYMVIDRRTVETGSFNYSKAAASSNAENVIVVWDNQELANRYLQNWNLHWEHAQSWRSTY